MARRKSNLTPGYGERLKRARLMLGLKQTDVADIVDLREFTLSRYETETIEPDRCFLAGLEHLTGIQRSWVEEGIEPMVKPPTTSASAPTLELLGRLEQELGGGPDTKLLPYPAAAGMVGMRPGIDFLLLRGGEQPLQEGHVFLIATAKGVTAGTARKTAGGWMLYHEADRDEPGTFPPTPLSSTNGVQVAAKVAFLT